MQKKRHVLSKLFASLLSCLTALSPAVSVIPVYADNDTDDTTSGIDITTDDGITVTEADTKSLSIEVDGFHGELIVNEGEDDEQTVRVSESDDEETQKVSVTDANGHVTEAEVNSENPYALVLTEEPGTVVTVQAKADSGFEVAQYSILMDSGAEEVTEFDTDTYSAFTYAITVDANKVLTVGFGEAAEGVSLISNVEGISIETETPESETDADISVEAESETDGKTSETESEETESNQIVMESERPADTFVSVYLGDNVATDDLNASDFASMRLVLLTDDASVIANEGDVVGQYDNIYLLQFTSIQQAMNAYVYYRDKVIAVEPDKVVETATDDAENDIIISMDTEGNPIEALNDVEESAAVKKAENVIALIDTGASEHANVIDRVSVIDEVLSGNNGHADNMVKAIVSQDANAQILSIRAMGDNGYGSVASLVAAMEYAMEHNVRMINLSLYGKTTLTTSVLKAEIQKAIDAGIIVVGAAGNDGADVADYMPGSVAEAYIIGACDKDGSRLELSNYGSTVDYYLVAKSTSEASALFTGFISANGLDAVAGVLNQGLIYETNYNNDDIVVEPDDSDIAVDNSADLSGYQVDSSKTTIVKYTFADRSMISSDDTLDSIYWDADGMCREDTIDLLFGTVQAYPEIWSDGNGTYKIKVDTMLTNGVAAYGYQDVIFAAGNNNGEVITDGVSFDFSTGIATVTEEALKAADDDFANIQIQVLVPVDELPESVVQDLTVVQVDGTVYTTKLEANPFTDESIVLSVEGSEAELTASDFTVYVNGETTAVVSEWDNDSHMLTLSGVVGTTVSSVKVVLNQNVDEMFRVASAYSYLSPMFYLKDGTDVSGLLVGMSQSVGTVIDGPTPGNYPGWSHPSAYISGNIYDSADYPGVDVGSILGYIGIPKNLFGINFQAYASNGASYGSYNDSYSGYNAAIASRCAHVSGKSYLHNGYVNITYRIVESWKSGDYTYFALQWLSDQALAASSLGNQHFGGVLVFAVKDAKPPFKIVKTPDTSDETCVGLIYKNGNQADGLLNAYSDLTTTFAVYSVTSSGSLNKKLGTVTTASDGTLTVSKENYGALLQLMTVNSTYRLVEVTAPDNYINAHSATNTENLESWTGPVEFVYKKDAVVTVTDPAAGDPGMGAMVKKSAGVNFPGDMYDFSAARYRLDYYEPKTDGSGYESTVTYSWEMKPTALTLAGSTYYIVSLSNINCYVNPSAVLFLNDDGYIHLPVGKYVLTETKAPIGFYLQDPVTAIVSYDNGTSEDGQGSPLFAWTSTGTGNTILGMDATAEYIVVNEPPYLYGIHIDKQCLGKNQLPYGTLEGVMFGVYNENDYSVVVNNKSYDPGDEIVTLRLTIDGSEDEGWTADTGAVLPAGTYSVKEIAGNGYYPLSDSTVATVTFTVDMADKTVLIPQFENQDYTWENEAIRGGTVIQKNDWLFGNADAHGNTNLSGAVFAVVPSAEDMTFAYTKDNQMVKAVDMGTNPDYDTVLKASKTNTIFTMTTDKNGNAVTSARAMTWGTYYIIEITPANGYELNTQYVGKIVIRNNGVIVKPVNVGTTSEDVDQMIYTGGLEIQKLDYMRDSDDSHGDTNLSGAEFTIVNASATSVVNIDDDVIQTTGLRGTNVTYAQVAAFAKNSKYVMEVITTDADGVARTEKHTCKGMANGKESLPYGTYYIIETKPAAGYLLNETWVGLVTITADGVMYHPTVIQDSDYHRDSNHATLGVPNGDTYAVRDQIYLSGLSLNKIDKEMQDATAQGTGTLKGAEFTIINVSDSVVRNAADEDIQTAKNLVSSNPTWEELAALDDKYTVQTITTNVEGRATTGTQALPYGTYYVIETTSSNGYFINDGFIGKVVIRDDNVMLELGAKATANGSYFKNINDESSTVVEEQIRRCDIGFLKVNIDGEYKQYIPFLISAIRLNEDGTETVIESHVMVCDENGQLLTSRNHSNHTNGMDKYLIGNSKISAEGEKYLQEAASWGIWFQGNSTSYPKDAVNDDFGGLYEGYYRITELQCEDNRSLSENLLASDLIHVTNDSVKYVEPMKDYSDISNFRDLVSYYGKVVGNAFPYVYHPLVDTEIVLTSEALDVESGTQTVPVRESVVVSDTVSMTHVSADHKYKLETQFVDLTTGKVLQILGTDDKEATVSEDSAWVVKEFSPKQQSGTNNTYDTISVTAQINTTGLEGHVIMAYDCLYEYIDITNNDAISGDWVLVARHPASGEEDDSQKLYVPSLHTTAYDKLTGDRVGVKSEDDAIIDIVDYENLAKSEEYVLVMTLVDTNTGKAIVKNSDGSAVTVVSPITFRRAEIPVSGTVTMPEFKLDSSDFADSTSVTVVETLYRAAEDGTPMGEPIVTHDSTLDEDQTIRWIDVGTTASDKNTKDDVGTDEDVATIYDTVSLSNVIFDDNDNDGQYVYTLKGHLVYQKDFTDANGVSHKAGEEVETLDGTKNEVVITSDAAGNIIFTYADGTSAEGQIVSSRYGHNVAKSVDETRVGDNSYIQDTTAMYCDLTVEVSFKVNSNDLAGGSVVVFEDLYHDSTGLETDVIVASHKDITDEGQTVHYPDIETSAQDSRTQDDVGARIEHEKIVDTVTLTNLVPGRSYVVNGTLMNQLTGEKMTVNGKDITQSASIYVTEDGQIVAGNGEKVTVTSYDAELHEVCGTIDLTFEFDSRLLAGETVVVFEDLIHNGITVAVHHDINDESQTVHFPDVHTTAIDGYTKDEVGTVAEKAVVVDTVAYNNLVPGRTYTIVGTLMNQKTGYMYEDADGNPVTVSRTIVAGQKGDGITVELDEEHHSVSGTIEMTFEFNGSNLEDTTLVVFEDLYHNNLKVTGHNDIYDEAQTVHFPKVRTSAIDTTTGDEVGVGGETTIKDVVNFWNLVADKDYTIKGVIYDKTTGEFLTDADGKQITAENAFHVNADGTVDNCCKIPCQCKGGTCTCADWAVCISDIDTDYKDSDGHASLIFNIDTTDLAGHDLVVFEYLYHNDVVVASHEDENDLGQTIHFAEIGTSAVDIDTNDTTGTVEATAQVVDTVSYKNLVVGRVYTIKGVLMNQYTGAPVVNEDGTLVTAEATFTATTESNDVNTVDVYDEADNSVSGSYKLTFTVDSTQLQGKTVVAFETLYHNDVKITAHTDLYDDAQSVHYSAIHTTAIDSNTGDHVGSIWGMLINGVRHLFGETDADGNGIADDKQQNMIDTVTLENLVPGHTYVVSGQLYDVDASEDAGEPVALLIDENPVVQAVTITVAENGKSITAADGSATSVVSYDKETNSVTGTVELVYALDSSKVQDTKLVVFEDLYHDSTYTPDMNPTDVKPEDIVNTHRDIHDEGQSVSEVGIHTTAIDTKTENHVGVIPSENDYSVIKDEVNVTKLVPDMEYTIVGALVDINASDFENGKVLYLTVDGTLTESREEAYEETFTFTAVETEEIHYLNFALTSDMVQGRALTVFEDIYHNGVKISSHPALSDVGTWDEVSFQNQTVYYPTGKTNATDTTTNTHTSYADGTRTIVDRVYFENLIVGENYEIDGQLVYQTAFTDANGVRHEAGEALDGVVASVKFTASDNMTEVAYTDRDGNAAVDTLTVTSLPNGQKVVSGYVSLEFTVDASALAGATLVAFETFKNNDVTIFTHADLNDLPQTIRIPEIHTSASVGDLDEASVYDEDGNFKEITIVDTVTYSNIWTQSELDAMHEQGLAIQYADGTYRTKVSDIYDINETATYIMKGTLMNKETGEMLTDANGNTYVVYSEPFTPESNSGTIDIEFVVNPADFIADGSDVSALEGLTVVAFEDLYQVTDKSDIGEGTIVATHHDIDDTEQDIRFPKARTHASDGIDTEVADLTDGQMLSMEDMESLEALHEAEITTTGHEVYATDRISIVDLVSVENLHGATVYTTTGTLMVVTEYDSDGNPVSYEPATDDNGNVITSTVDFDTTALSDDYNASVSGYVPVTFMFAGTNLAGKTTVAFETVSRDGVVVAVHADITDGLETIYLPAIHTNATDALTGLSETLAGSQTVILDKVSYENLEYGKTYSLTGSWYRKSDATSVDGASVTGTFVAGVENQFIMADGTKVMTLDELRSMYDTTASQSSWDSATSGDTNTGTNVGSDGALDISEKTEYVVGVDIPAGYYKITPVDNDGTGLFGYWCIYYSEDGSVPTERTLATTLTNGIVTDTHSVDYIRLADNMVLQIANSVINGAPNSVFEQVSEAEAMADLNYQVASYFEKLENTTDNTDVVESDVTESTETTVDEIVDATDVVDTDTVVAESSGDMTNRVSGDVYVVIVVDTSDLAGDTLVAFESLSAKDDNGNDKVIATHEDITDVDQSVAIPEIHTSATIDGAKTAEASSSTTVVDTVSYSNLTPGRTYQMLGVLMDKMTGKSTGVTASTEFTPDEASGTVEVVFTLDTTSLVGRQLVVFEELVTESEGTTYVVAQHKDITDAAQTVTVTQPPEDRTTINIDTGDMLQIGYLIGGVSMVLLLAGLAILRKKRYRA